MMYSFYVIIEHTRDDWHGTTQTMTYAREADGTEEEMRAKVLRDFNKLLSGDPTITDIHVNGALL